ncbi:MAG TPA: thioesterase family protein [Candidatus Acidoferrum sp.]|nr:thioesterase family protein [Candidatus Acidoferrum sp.]
MKPPSIPLEKILALEPVCLRLRVPEAYRDRNRHMNMRWYVAIFDDAGDGLYLRRGLTPEFHRQRGTGTFDLEHHTHFLSEVVPGDQVAVYVRLVAHSAKRMHYLMFMVNETTGKLAAMFECLTAFADLTIRRTAPFPPEIAAKIEAGVAEGLTLDWPAPVCGAMHV